MPEIRTSIDRRALRNIGEAVSEEAVSRLICFICACKHLRVSGHDALGDPCEKGKIKFLEGGPLSDKLLYGSTDEDEQLKRDENISAKYFKKRLGHAVCADTTWGESK